MKLVLSLLLSVLTITSCSNTVDHGQNQIQTKYNQYNNITVYSELVIIDGLLVENKMSFSGDHEVKIRILRTSSSNNKQVRQSYHKLKVKLNAKKHYQIMTNIEDEALKIWLVDGVTFDVVSTVSTVDTIFEKVFTLTNEFQDEMKRIKIILKNKQDKIAHVKAISKRKPIYEWN